VERQLSKLSSQETELTEALAENASDYARLIELGKELREVQDEKAGLEDRWLTLAEEVSG
jgi:ATP-binding cassette subfamily F protein uup